MTRLIQLTKEDNEWVIYWGDQRLGTTDVKIIPGGHPILCPHKLTQDLAAGILNTLVKKLQGDLDDKERHRLEQSLDQAVTEWQGYGVNFV